MSLVPNSDPVSAPLTALAATAATWACPVLAHRLHVVNRGTGDVYITIDGSAPTGAAGTNEWFLAAGDGSYVDIEVMELGPLDTPTGYAGPSVQAISAAALTIYITVVQ